jgi:anti-sigma-K factor RskA
MTAPDPFVHDDAAYVLGALSDDERAAFEAHLATCADCRARVAEIRGVPALLAGITAADLAEEAPPETLLPGLMRRAHRRRGRQRLLVGGLGAVAAACLIALAVVVWPFGSSGSGSGQPAPRALHALVNVPVQATARLVATSWGTEIDLNCRYADGVEESRPYRLVVVDRQGHDEDLGSWRLPPDADISYTAGTALQPADIARVQITSVDGTPLLELATS